EVALAGYPVTAGRATTIEGVKYQYFTRPMINRVGRYDEFFPSASLKYRLSQNFDFHFGYSSTIRRPTYRAIAGVWSINDEAGTVNAPNPRLKPEMSDNFSVRAAYYFEPVGIVAINFFQNNVQGLHRTTQMTAQEYGYDGPLDLSNYIFTSTIGSENEVVVRGMELEYSQSLSFLPAPFSGLNIRGSYTRNYADVVITNMAGHTVSAGLGYTLNRFNVYSNVNWQDDRPTNIAFTRYIRRRFNVDMGGSVRVTPRISIFLNVRNILDEPYIDMQKLSNGSSTARKFEIFGTNYTLGVKGTF
ncbi:MAG TPA: TonB-dependent receptor, partial [Opitutaceae bacterium]|nr:TonB-dependent receptor [Opitutaceae bacterium]